MGRGICIISQALLNSGPDSASDSDPQPTQLTNAIHAICAVQREAWKKTKIAGRSYLTSRMKWTKPTNPTLPFPTSLFLSFSHIINPPPPPEKVDQTTFPNAGISVCANQKLNTNFGPVINILGVNPLKKLLNPSFRTILPTILKPLSGLSKFRF